MNGLDEIRQRYPWPDERPDVIEDWTGWFYRDNMELLRSLLTTETKVVIELGSLCGLSSKFLAEVAPNATIICVDHWKGSPEHQEREGWDERLRELYLRFLRNLWPLRDRVIPMRTTIQSGLREIYALHITPDVVYLDGAHDEDSVLRDMTVLMKLFPKAHIVGDDWMRGEVRLGVVRATSECKYLSVPGPNAWHLPVEGRSCVL